MYATSVAILDHGACPPVEVRLDAELVLGIARMTGDRVAICDGQHRCDRIRSCEDAVWLGREKCGLVIHRQPSGEAAIFQRTVSGDIHFWTGIPNCQGAHDALLALLAGSSFLGPHQTLSVRQQGNLGEFISLHAARNAPIPHQMAFAHNAIQPLQDLSYPGLDLAYVNFGATEKDDLLYIQEVKTTGGINLAYADNLIADHQKLFGESPQLTYNTRVQSIAARIRYEHNRPDLSDRVLKLSASAASQCSQVRLVPTLVHERIGTQPQVKMSAVRSAIIALGWDAQNVEPWAIAMESLIARLTRLARGQQ